TKPCRRAALFRRTQRSGDRDGVRRFQRDGDARLEGGAGVVDARDESQNDDIKMSNARWQHIQHLYHAALERPARTRAEFLRDVCDGDRALADEVQSLLDQPVSAEKFLESVELESESDTPSVHVGQ